MSIIKKIRNQIGITQEQMALELNIEQGAISNYENGCRRPTIKIAYAIKRFASENGIEVSLEDIYPEHD